MLSTAHAVVCVFVCVGQRWQEIISTVWEERCRVEAKVAVCSATDPWSIHPPVCLLSPALCLSPCLLLLHSSSIPGFFMHIYSGAHIPWLPPLLRLSQFRDSSLWSHISFALLPLRLTSQVCWFSAENQDGFGVGCLEAVLSSLQSFLWPEIRSIPPSGDCTVRQGRSFPYCELNRCLVIALYLCGLAVYYCLNLSSSVLAGASMSLNNCLFLWCCQHIVFLNRQWKEIVRTEQNKETRKTAH